VRFLAALSGLNDGARSRRGTLQGLEPQLGQVGNRKVGQCRGTVARSARYSKAARSRVSASLLDEGPETEPDMPIYPLEFCKRFEERWKRRARESGSTSRAPQTGKNRDVIGLPPQEDDDAVLSRWPWLLTIGQGLQSEYATLKQPADKRLVTLLKKLRRL
jgi:hypothetical protein